MFPVWLQAGFWGLVGGSALLLGAAMGYFVSIPQRAMPAAGYAYATIMAFGAGVLMSALSFELMDEAFKSGGFDSTAIGFLGGAIAYTAANWYLSHQGAKHRKRSGSLHPAKKEKGDGGLAIAFGALLDGKLKCVVECVRT